MLKHILADPHYPVLFILFSGFFFLFFSSSSFSSQSSNDYAIHEEDELKIDSGVRKTNTVK